MSSYRISKVLSELNIGLDTAVDYLKSKGHEVEKNRNAKIDQAQYDLLLESFASDKTSKDKAETLIQQKREEKEAIQAERIEAEKAKPEVIRGTAKLDGPKISGKIDLAPKAKAAPASPVAEKPAAPAAPAAPVVEKAPPAPAPSSCPGEPRYREARRPCGARGPCYPREGGGTSRREGGSSPGNRSSSSGRTCCARSPCFRWNTYHPVPKAGWPQTNRSND